MPWFGAKDDRYIKPRARLSTVFAISAKIVLPLGVEILAKPFPESWNWVAHEPPFVKITPAHTRKASGEQSDGPQADVHPEFLRQFSG